MMAFLVEVDESDAFNSKERDSDDREPNDPWTESRTFDIDGVRLYFSISDKEHITKPNCNGGATVSYIDVMLEVPRTWTREGLRRHLTEIRPILMDVVRHELGHLLQDDLANALGDQSDDDDYQYSEDDEGDPIIPPDVVANRVWKYLSTPIEIKQWSAGMMTRAKNARIPIDDVIDASLDDVNGWLDDGGVPQELAQPLLDRVKALWVDAIRRRYPRARWRPVKR